MQHKFLASSETPEVFKEYQWHVCPGALSFGRGRYEEDLKYTISAGMFWLDKRPKGYINFTKNVKALDHSTSQRIECLKDILRKAAMSVGADDVESLVSEAFIHIIQAKRLGWDVYQFYLQEIAYATLRN